MGSVQRGHANPWDGGAVFLVLLGSDLHRVCLSPHGKNWLVGFLTLCCEVDSQILFMVKLKTASEINNR